MQAPPDATTPLGKINPFSKIAVTFEQIVCNFDIPKTLKCYGLFISQFYNWKLYHKSFWCGSAVRLWQEKSQLIIESSDKSNNDNIVCRAAPGFARVC